MSKCQFSISFSGDADTLISKANKAIKLADGKFEGDSHAGEFSLKTPIGSVKGNYQIENESINVEISEKPMFLSCNKIESELQNYLLS